MIHHCLFLSIVNLKIQFFPTSSSVHSSSSFLLSSTIISFLPLFQFEVPPSSPFFRLHLIVYSKSLFCSHHLSARSSLHLSYCTANLISLLCNPSCSIFYLTSFFSFHRTLKFVILVIFTFFFPLIFILTINSHIFLCHFQFSLSPTVVIYSHPSDSMTLPFIYQSFNSSVFLPKYQGGFLGIVGQGAKKAMRSR